MKQEPFVLSPLPENPGRLVRAHCRDRLSGYVIPSEEGQWSCILRCGRSWRFWSSEMFLEVLTERLKQIYEGHRAEWLEHDTNYPILIGARFEVLPLGETGRKEEETFRVRSPGHEAGRDIILRFMEALNDPKADARLAARKDEIERRQALILCGYSGVNHPDRDAGTLLHDLTDLHLYLKARKSKEDGDRVRFEVEVEGQARPATAEWDTDAGEVRFVLGGDLRVLEADHNGQVSSRAVERVLAGERQVGESVQPRPSSRPPADE